MNRELAVKILKDILGDYEGENFRKDKEALEYAIKELERTAQEVSVQEQLRGINNKVDSIQICLTIFSVTIIVILINILFN